MNKENKSGLDKFITDSKMNRKEAIKKVSKYAAFTALGTMIILSPKESQASSSGPEPPMSQPEQEPKNDKPSELKDSPWD